MTRAPNFDCHGRSLVKSLIRGMLDVGTWQTTGPGVTARTGGLFDLSLNDHAPKRNGSLDLLSGRSRFPDRVIRPHP